MAAWGYEFYLRVLSGHVISSNYHHYHYFLVFFVL